MLGRVDAVAGRSVGKRDQTSDTIKAKSDRATIGYGRLADQIDETS